MSSPIIFYDVLSALHPPQWSSNALRTRLALNFLRLPYKTVFLSYPDIEPTLSGLGLQPNNPPPYDKQPKYTLPVIKDGEKYVSGAFAIAEYLGQAYPSSLSRPALFPANSIPFARLVQDYLVEKVLVHARKVVLPRVPTWLDERGAAYFRSTRQQWLGVPLEDYRPSPAEQAKIRADVLKGIDGIARMLRDHPDGPFLQGKDAGYSDLQMIAVMAWIRRGDEETWKEILKRPEMRELWEACEPWLA